MLSIALIGTSLSMDAFAISLTNGLTAGGSRLRHILLPALYFGGFQFLMPLLGSFLAGTVSGYVSSLGPYISFLLLGFIGGKMLWGAAKEYGKAAPSPTAALSHLRLLALAVATSIDALAVGASFAFMDVHILPACAVIGAVTLVICGFGGLLGRHIPGASGRVAEILGGIVLIIIGLKLLIGGIMVT